MRFLKEFSYPDLFQRRLVFINAFFSCLLAGCVYTGTLLSIHYLSPYTKAVLHTVLPGLSWFCAGNLLGRVLFSRVKNHRLLYIATDALFSISCLVLLFGGMFFPGDRAFAASLFFSSPLLFYALVGTTGLFAGIKLNYFLKISCGEFIDEKKAIITFIPSIMIGTACGIIISFVMFVLPPIVYLLAVPVLLIAATAPLITLPYNTSPAYTQEVKGPRTEGTSDSANARRDDLIFTYLNFTFILVYVFLGYQTVIRASGNFVHGKLLFFAVSCIMLFAGFYCGRILKRSFWHIYTEMLYPVFFLVFLILVFNHGGNMSSHAAVALFIPTLFYLGLSGYHTLQNVILHYTDNERYKIIDLSLFIITFPPLVALQFADLTNLWFFMVLYAMAMVNVLFPGLHLLQRRIDGYKKFLYIVFSLIFIPLVIIIHMYFGISLRNNLYVRLSAGFPSLSNVNQDADFVKHDADVLLNGKPIFHSSDDTLKNLQRSLLAAFPYSRQLVGGRSTCLFIDGNQKFYSNPSIAYFEKARCIDYVPPRTVDFNRIPLTGKKFYFLERADPISFLGRSKKKYGCIIDIPNLYDQRFNAFLYSADRYRRLKGALGPEGFFVQVFNLTYCRSDFITLAVSSLDRRFKRVIGYLFSDHLVILAADDERSLLLNDAGLKAYQSLFKENPVLHTLFYNDVQLFTHVAAADMKQIRSYLERQDLHPLFAFQKPQRCGLDSRISRAFATEHLRILEVVDRSPGFQQYKNNLAVAISGGAPVYSLLKQAGMYEISGDQGKEAEALLTLRRYAEYNLELRTYVTRLFAFKEEYYFLKAIEYEKSKNWEEAGKLYRAILLLNPDNFDANYRLGILSITLQNLDDAFAYLQKAMQLKRDDAKVLYQMGVLLFATGRLTEALDYLQRALSLNENSASVFYYLGLCNEKLGRLAEARAYYEKALTLDPNDRAIQSSMETIQKMLEDEKNKWKSPDLKNQYDVEQGESIPLPINKSAQDIRLKDEE